jgi:hypothetical protein
MNLVCWWPLRLKWIEVTVGMNIFAGGVVGGEEERRARRRFIGGLWGKRYRGAVKRLEV